APAASAPPARVRHLAQRACAARGADPRPNTVLPGPISLTSPSCHVPINRLDGTRSALPALATPVAAPSPTHIGRPARARTLQMFTRLQRLRSAIAIGAVIGAFACGSARAADAPGAHATDTARATAPAPATDAARAAAPARPKSTLGDTTRPATFLK